MTFDARLLPVRRSSQHGRLHKERNESAFSNLLLKVRVAVALHALFVGGRRLRDRRMGVQNSGQKKPEEERTIRPSSSHRNPGPHSRHPSAPKNRDRLTNALKYLSLRAPEGCVAI